jgi:hypothetical protein
VIVLVATTDLHAGDEVLVSYGTGFWKKHPSTRGGQERKAQGAGKMGKEMQSEAEE